MRRWIRRLALLVVLSGCQGAVAPSATVPPPGMTATQDGVTVTLASATPPVLGQSQAWTITVRDRQGSLRDDAQVYLQLVMPGMPMGQQQPWASVQGNGQYQATGVYIMDGPWQVLVHVTLDQVEYIIPFAVEVHPAAGKGSTHAHG